MKVWLQTSWNVQGGPQLLRCRSGALMTQSTSGINIIWKYVEIAVWFSKSVIPSSQPLILFRDSERRIFYRWPIFSKHKRRPFRRRRRKYPRKPASRGSSEGDIYSSSNYYRQPQSSYQEEDYYQEAASSSRRHDQDSESESDGYRSWYAGDYQEEFANSYNYQPSQSDSYPSSYRDSYTQHSEQYGAGSEPFNWESWDSKKFSR